MVVHCCLLARPVRSSTRTYSPTAAWHGKMHPIPWERPTESARLATGTKRSCRAPLHPRGLRLSHTLGSRGARVLQRNAARAPRCTGVGAARARGLSCPLRAPRRCRRIRPPTSSRQQARGATAAAAAAARGQGMDSPSLGARPWSPALRVDSRLAARAARRDVASVVREVRHWQPGGRTTTGPPPPPVEWDAENGKTSRVHVGGCRVASSETEGRHHPSTSVGPCPPCSAAASVPR